MKMIQIQKRDQKIAQSCYEQQFVRAQELMQSHFKGVHRSEVYRRLQELEKAGYLKRIRPFPGSPVTLFRLTEAGIELARQNSPMEVPQTRRLNPSTIVHDAYVTSVRIRLEELWNFTWIPEAVLKAEYGKKQTPNSAIGDGMMNFPSGKKAILELENSLKSPDRYRQIFSNWNQSSHSPSFVLYVATDQNLSKRLKVMMERYAPKELPIFLITIEDLLKHPPSKVWSIRGEFAIFERKEF
jgi:DNA-binding PadR family transcriptional regulator